MIIDPNVVLLLIAVFNALTAVITWWTHRATKETQADVLKIEKATNSMKDALVAATAKASEAKGRDEERLRGEDKARTLLTENPPIPVADEKTTEAVNKVVEAIKETQ